MKCHGRYTNYFYYFIGNIKIPMLRKREQIKKNNCLRETICYSSIEEQSVNFWLPRTWQYGCEYGIINFLNMSFEMDHCDALSWLSTCGPLKCLFCSYVLYRKIELVDSIEVAITKYLADPLILFSIATVCQCC